MNPSFSNMINDKDTLKFTISDINVSFVNALRRIIISEISCVVFRTFPHKDNLCDIEINTTRMNNELIKQRLTCVPIYINDLEFPINNYLVEVDVKNDTETIKYITTEDFKIKDINSDTYLSKEQRDIIFPKNNITGDFIEFARIRPKISDDIHGEHLMFSSKFDYGIAKNNASWNMVSTCSYGFTQDIEKINNIWNDKKNILLKEEKTLDEIEFYKKDWLLLDAKRITLKNSFDFIIETIGVYSNKNIIIKACNVMFNKLQKFKNSILEDQDLIYNSNSTIINCYDIKLIGEDYTLGKVIEFILYNNYYKNKLSFCGFRKIHPHDSDSIIRIAFNDSVNKNEIINIISECCSVATDVFTYIMNYIETLDI